MRKNPLHYLRRMHPAVLSREERILDIIVAFMGIGVGLMFIGMAVVCIAMQMVGAAVSFFCLGLLSIGLGWHLGEGVRRDSEWRDGSRTWEEPK